VNRVERWHLPSIEASGQREPRVLFSQPEFRGVVVDLDEDGELGEHQVREHLLVHVVAGRVHVTAGTEEAECEAGSLVRFAPGETHGVRALEPSRILLLLAPWPGAGHFPEGRETDPARIATGAAEPPHE
jgi:quercetin dioxygenase-like cupin family protein